MCDDRVGFKFEYFDLGDSKPLKLYNMLLIKNYDVTVWIFFHQTHHENKIISGELKQNNATIMEYLIFKCIILLY